MNLIQDPNKPPQKLRTISIVFQETQEGKFSLFVGGDAERMVGGVADKDLGAAEYWAKVCFGITLHKLQEAGVIKMPEQNAQEPKKPTIA